jgi:hypothetical protein
MTRRKSILITLGSTLFSIARPFSYGMNSNLGSAKQWEYDAIVAHWPQRSFFLAKGIIFGYSHLYGFVESSGKDAGVYELFDKNKSRLKVIVGDLEQMISIIEKSYLDKVTIIHY